MGCESGRLNIQIVSLTPEGLPGNTVLGRSSINARRLPNIADGGFQKLRIRGRVNVTAGQKLAFTLSNMTGSCGVVSAPAGDSYSGGEAFFDARPNPPGWVRQSDVATPTTPLDLAFETVVR